jgi:large subunit ribosomal protein L5
MAALKLSIKEYIKNTKEKVVSELGKRNQFAYPEVDHISINVGVGKHETKDIDSIAQNLLRLTAQKPQYVASKKSIAGFKLRAGKVVGLRVTLRGSKKDDFLFNLIYLALPRTRDFQGLNPKSFDKTQKTYSIGIRTATIFPTIGYDVDTDFGLQVNIVFKSAGPDNLNLLQAYQLPLQEIN